MIAALKPCSQPGGCSNLVESGKCPQHTKQADVRRGTSTQRGYDADHRAIRVLCFQRDHWRCCKCGWTTSLISECERLGIALPPTETILADLTASFRRNERHLHADHIVRIDRGPEHRLSLHNLQTLCNVCHAAKTLSETREAQAW